MNQQKQTGQKNTGLGRLVKAFGYSCKGFRSTWKSEQAFRQEAMLSLLLVPLGLWLGDSGVERALLVFTALLVPLVELINSAIEAVVDRIGEEQHPLSANAKDMGSAAVFMSFVILLVVWASVVIG
jgi:diacylglycerol kinase (ATP)